MKHGVLNPRDSGSLHSGTMWGQHLAQDRQCFSRMVAGTTAVFVPVLFL